MVGVGLFAITVRDTRLLAARPRVLFTTTWNVAPLSARVVDGITYDWAIAVGTASPAATTVSVKPVGRVVGSHRCSRPLRSGRRRVARRPARGRATLSRIRP